ncbi:MAG: hypothetical protein ABIQ15_10890 [Nocardioides sp.]
MATRREHPILQGLIALVTVGVTIGLLVGLGTLLLTQGLGLGEGSATAVDTASGGSQTMLLPKPEETATSPGPLVSLQPSEETGAAGSTGSAAPTTQIVLSAGQTAVAPMQQIDLTGSYAGGEGAVLQVQRFDGGGWQDFPVTASVSGGSFTTYIQTSQTGEVRFRMADTDTGATSNEITVQIG